MIRFYLHELDHVYIVRDLDDKSLHEIRVFTTFEAAAEWAEAMYNSNLSKTLGTSRHDLIETVNVE